MIAFDRSLFFFSVTIDLRSFHAFIEHLNVFSSWHVISLSNAGLLY